MTKPLWQPAPEEIAATVIHRFCGALSRKSGQPLAGSDDLHRLSVREPERFWTEFWTFAGIIGDPGAAPYLVDGDRIERARFFPDASLNYAENLLTRTDQSTAIVFRGEDKVSASWSWQRLSSAVAGFQERYRAAGVGAGDRVAAILPNLPESIAAFLGAASIGAVWSSCSPDFGVEGVLDRFGQIDPTVLVVVDGYYYSGKTIRLADKLIEIVARLPTLKAVIVVPYIGEAAAVADSLANAAVWHEPATPQRPQFVRLPFAHPLYILYSSGTTGIPKCIVHGAGGILLKHLTEQRLHCDLRSSDRLFYFTTLGWMMWNWLVSGLATGATLLLYDGAPLHPSPAALFDFAEAEGMTIFGTSAKFIDSVRKSGFEPIASHRLASVRMMCSTGSPLVPESFDFVYSGIKRDIHLASISGGTDICGCFVLGDPTKPVWRGEIQGPAFGVAMDVFDDDGHPLRSGKGELVCTRPFPSMPVGFWNDADGSKYHKAYFARFANIWHHGDFAEWTPHGGMVIHGRSDATLNPGGVRIGTAEIYRQVEGLTEVQESIVIGQDFDNDVRVVLFVVMRQGHQLDDALRDRIRRVIREGASPRHVPARILQVADIPRTKSGKITELAVRDVVHGRPVKNREALANPEALELFADRPELAS